MPNPSLVRREKGLVRHTIHQLLHVDILRYAVAAVRFTWFTKFRRHLRTVDGVSAAPNTVMHNLRGMDDLAVNRSLYLTRPLSTIERLTSRSDLLVIGPRTEGEILGLLAHGFDRRHLCAVDLMSYSPWVDLGDMHELPYEAASFDAVVMGWVLAYSEDRAKAAAEVRRVLRPGGVVAIGVEWEPKSNETIVSEIGYLPGSTERISGCDEILELFSTAVDEVLVREEPDRDQVSAMVVIFTVR